MRSRLIACLVALVIYLVGTVAMMLLLAIPVLILAGPHSDLLPLFAQKIVLVAAWLLVLFVPLLVAIRGHKGYLKRKISSVSED